MKRTEVQREEGGLGEGRVLAVVEYLRPTVQADGVADRRLVEEIERSNRIGRDLLLRLEERTEETSQEQPL